MRRLRNRRGFTLIELLVVVAIIALLISILLPSLRDAKEQANVAKCLSNFRQLMLSTFMYFEDYNDTFPLFVSSLGGGLSTCSWTYGGKTSHEDWKTFGEGWVLPVHTRPINEYIMGGEFEPDLMDGNTVLKRTEIPGVHCPSDRASHQRLFNQLPGDEALQISSYDDIGTSYHFNLQSLQDTNIDVWANQGQGWLDNCRAIVKDTIGGMVSTFTFYWEDPMDFALYDKIQKIGNHRKLNKHSVGFLDGHAEYKLIDTRDYCGVGWNTINPNWVYKFGMQRPPIYYTEPGKNCDPKNH